MNPEKPAPPADRVLLALLLATDGLLVVLNILATQIDGTSGWERLAFANRINNAGIIAGQGVFDTEQRGFLMLPDSP